MSELDRKIKERTVARRIFSKSANELDTLLDKTTEITVDSQVAYQNVSDLADGLLKLDEMIKELLLVNFEEEELVRELESALKYKTKWRRLDAKYQQKFPKISSIDDKYCASNNKTNLRLPKLSLQHFNGELKSWLPFWGQFTKIDSDTSMNIFDKYQYLSQCMKEDTEAKKLVESFPPSAYNECIEQLKARYGREDLLIQVYIREILALILKGNIDVLFQVVQSIREINWKTEFTKITNIHRTNIRTDENNPFRT